MARGDAAALEDRIARLRELVDKQPDDASAWFGLGRAWLERGEPAQAIVPLRRAIAIAPDYTAAHRDLGRSLLEAGSAAEAARVLSDAVELAERTGDLQTGREVRVFLRRARARLGESESRPASRAAGAPRAPATPPTPEARAHYREGFEHAADGRFEEAVACYRRAIELHPDYAIAWNALSMALRQRGELDAAIEAGQRLAELEPDDPLSHTNLSILYQNKGMIPEAEDEKALAMRLQMRSQRST